MSKNYTVYHLHSDLSNGVTNIDSVTKYNQVIERARECGMTALAFSEHGSLFEWWNKKQGIEEAGMKYIHAAECYLTESLDEKIRDNYHLVLIAKNYDGFLELNRLISRSFCRTDNHFYYVPRISFEELQNTSANILFTTACIGGVLNKAEAAFEEKFLRFCRIHRDRCYLEIGHHLDTGQIEYNRKLYQLSNQTGIPLIAGTDTHCLNDKHRRGRAILQKSKSIFFGEEENWDLTFKTYDELVDAYRSQRSLPEDVFLTAIENTNRMADRVEAFTIDCGTKYPRIYDNPEDTFRQKVYSAAENHPYISKRYTTEETKATLDEEIEVYKKVQSIDFMLLQTYVREWERANGIQCGYGRGSVAGSFVAYALGITEMDSKKFDLNFFRFANPERVTNADIDTDYSNADREKVKHFLLHDRMNLENIRTAEIITFNTIALKGSVRDVARALEIPLETVSKICDEIGDDDQVPDSLRRKYPELFEYVDIVNGTIVSIGTHPSGVLVSDLDIESLIGLCSISSTDYPVSMLNMKELDKQMWVKLDILG